MLFLYVITHLFSRGITSEDGSVIFLREFFTNDFNFAFFALVIKYPPNWDLLERYDVRLEYRIGIFEIIGYLFLQLLQIRKPSSISYDCSNISISKVLLQLTHRR